MSSYEEEYRKYYSDTKAKLKIKTKDKKSSIKNKKVFEEDLLEGVYPKINYKNSDDKIYNFDKDENMYKSKDYEDEIYMLDEYKTEDYMDKNNKSNSLRKNICIIQENSCGTYRGLESYGEINNYDNTNSQRGFEVYNRSAYYGQVGGNLNISKPVNNFIGGWINKFIIKIALTVVLFIFVVGFKYSPYEKIRNIYTSFKVAVDKDFKYEDFTENFQVVNVMKKVNELKESLQMKSDEMNNLN